MKLAYSIAIVLALLLYLSKLVNCNSIGEPYTTLYVKPDQDQNAACPTEKCRNLNFYADPQNNLTESNNTQFVFLPGLHHLNRCFHLAYKENIALIHKTNESEGVTIQCTGKQAGFIFENVRNLMLLNLTISYCGQKVWPAPPTTFYEQIMSVQASLALRDIHTLTMQSVTIQHSHGYGVAAAGVYGNSVIKNCLFENNTGAVDRYIGGNFVLKYKECSPEHTSELTNLTIAQSQFLHGYTKVNIDGLGTAQHQANATGIALFLSCTNVSVNLSNVQLDQNKAESNSSKGGNLFIFLGSVMCYTRINVLVEDSTITHGTATMGGGAYIRFRQPRKNSKKAPCDNHVTFRNTNFTLNTGQYRGGAMSILFEKANMYQNCPKGTVEIDRCHFKENILHASKADSGVAISVYTYYINGVSTISLPPNKVNISGSCFFNNRLLPDSVDLVTGGSTVYITNQRRETFISDSSFIGNNVTAISAIGSTIVFQGQILIKDNTGINGGGLVLCQASYLLFAPNTNVTFQENHAVLSGGGIFAEEQCLQYQPLCFYQVYEKSNSTMKREDILNSIHVKMINNTANYTGSQIFGGTMDFCRTSFDFNNTKVYSKIFNESTWSKNESDSSYITSYARHACFCDEKGKPKCGQMNKSVTIYPRERLNVSIVAVGQFHHPVPATIIINYQNLKIPRTIKAYCTEVSIKKLTTKHSRLSITVSSDTGYSTGSHLRWIDIHYRKCPMGTDLDHRGVCITRTYKAEAMFNANTHKIKKNERTWMGYYNANTSKIKFPEANGHGLISLENHCSPWYCRNTKYINVSETEFDQDSQCNNRKGILCGACDDSHSSLAFASSKCLNCRWGNKSSYIALLGLGTFAIVLIVLCFLLCFNITITEGTVSGLLFHVSLFNINRELFIRADIHFGVILSLFAWLNLDIGVLACFFDGFDAFWQTIFSFTVPVIIWLLLGLVIYLSSKSTRITALIGNKAVPVVATLFLISYTKILQAEVKVFSCANIAFPTNIWSKRVFQLHWLPDGNIVCFEGKHIALVVLGVLFGAATLFYTLTLLFIQPLQRYSHVRGLKWVAKLKPFFDAYTSPHVIKERYRFWPGFLLLCRLGATIGFEFSSTRNEEAHYMIAMMFMCVVILVLFASLGGIYKKWWLNVLNVSYYFNFTLLSVMIAYSFKKFDKHSAEQQQHDATYISLGVALLTFMLIICYHVYKRLSDAGLLSRWKRKVKSSQCWTAVKRYRQRSRIRYVRLPQEDPNQDRELRDDFNGERDLGESDDEEIGGANGEPMNEGTNEEDRDNQEHTSGNEVGPSGDSY